MLNDGMLMLNAERQILVWVLISERLEVFEGQGLADTIHQKIAALDMKMAGKYLNQSWCTWKYSGARFSFPNSELQNQCYSNRQLIDAVKDSLLTGLGHLQQQASNFVTWGNLEK